MKQFRDDFEDWLDRSLAAEIPASVVAFSFNLFEHSSGASRYGVELIGASEFDCTDPDWACSEVWEPENGRSLDIPLMFCDDGWEVCLSRMIDLVKSVMQENSPSSEKLRSVRGVGIGFVDGELHLLKSD